MAPSELVAACKLYAAACSAAAHKLTDPDRKKILLDRAEACLTLADQIEKNRASAAEAETETASQRQILPKNLRPAVKQLNDGELDELLKVAFDEAKRRGRLPPRVKTDSTSVPGRPSDLVNNRSSTNKRRHAPIDEVPLTRGQMNVVRSAFKAGITPSRIARQFGISPSNVRKALASDGAKR
jgi:DNA-binding CsgD family transcriptional regulator